ncbi:MAG TPA: EamA family transporter, partial [Vicinamibacterales bacterium]|nr:EamA family transporter [Vicinamibacterales bacterium]
DGLVPALACGVLDTLAHVSYTLAAQRGLLSIVAPIGSMYPAGTIALAALLLGERLTATQIAGLACGAVAILLLA